MQKFVQKHTVIFLAIFVLSLLVAGCQSQSGETIEPTTQETVEVEVTSTPTQSASSSEEDTEAEAMAAEPAEVNQCLLCHTDQVRLEETADPVVVVESESSGEG
jgi:hypothetical protein